LPGSRAQAASGFDVLLDPGIGPMIRPVERRIPFAMAGADRGLAVASGLRAGRRGAFAGARVGGSDLRSALHTRKPMATKKAAKKKSRRTVMYSSGGKKLYAVRDAGGKFKDIQQ
jgi:hypothetical protein